MHRTDINFRPSRQFNGLLLAVLLGSIAIIVTVPVSMLIKAVGLAFVLLYGALIFWRHGLVINNPSAIVGLKLNQDGWFLIIKQEMIAVELCGESTVTLFASVLRFKCTNSAKKHSCIVFNDSLKSDDYRRLIVQLRTNTAHKAEQARHHLHRVKRNAGVV